MQKLKVWEDVLDETLDMQVAPELGDVINKTAHKIYTEPEEFFKRTYFTDSMVQILDKLLNTLSGKERHNLFLIYSLFGGGKTHTILTIYHAISNPDSLTDEIILKDYPEEKKEKIKNIGIKLKILQNQNIKILPIYGKGKLGQPSNPLNFGAYEVKTLWGYIGHCLGKYSIVENDDKNLTVPTIETIRELLKGNRVVFLVDEIVHYIDNLYNSGNEDDRRYAKNICKFFDALCTALIGTDSIMVLTLPMEKDGEKVEKGYNKEIVLSLHRAVERVGGAELYSPLRTEGISGGEIVEILKKRIFENIDNDFKEKIIEKYREVYSNTEIFGRFENDISKTYPFHPDYIATLRTIVERGNLQKTRDMVRITRIVIRNLLQEEEFPTLIMPYHIDPRNEKLKGILFGKNQIFADYGGAVLDVDLSLEKFKRFSKPELAEIILRYIFLKTYPYDSPTPLEGFPKRDSIARAVYEINFFEKHALQLTDISNTISEIEKSSSFIYLNKKDGVFWFWRVANVSQMVESKKDELLTLDIVAVHRKLEEFVKRHVEGKGLKTKKIGDTPFFKKSNIVVSREPQEFQDTEDYKLQILIRDDVDKSLLKKLIYQYGTGTRTYRNTITVCYADKTLNKLLEITARIMACDRVKGDIKAKYKAYGEDVVQIQTSMVKSIEDDAKAEFDEFIASVFKKVAYPKDNDIEIANATPASKSILENVYSTLLSWGKVLDSLSFEGLEYYLNEVNKSFKNPIPFSEIRGVIRTNTKLPFITDEQLKEAIKEGVKDLKIGIERNGRILFKRIYQSIPNHDEVGTLVDDIKENDIILPQIKALNKQINQILKDEKEEIIDNKYIKVWYEVYLPSHSEPLPLRELVEETEEDGFVVKPDFVDVIINGYIVRRFEEKIIKEEHEFSLKLDKHCIEGKPGELVDIKISITPLKGNNFTVTLEVEEGELDIYSETAPYEAVWHIKIPETKQTYKIKAISEDGVIKTDKVTLIPRTDITEVYELTEDLKGCILLEIKNIKSSDDLSLIPENLDAKVRGGFIIENDEYFKADFSNMAIDVVKYIIEEIEGIMEAKAKLNVDVIFAEGVKIDDLIFEKLRCLNKKATFKVKKC